MDAMQQFEELRRASEVEESAVWEKFLRVNADFRGAMERLGVSVSYTSEHDHLYVTLGEPREGMAIFSGSVVLIVDPDTAELLGVEVPGFERAVESGAVGDEWALLASLIEDKTEIRVPPVQDEHDIKRVLGQALERELAVA